MTKPLADWTATECIREISRLAGGTRIDALTGQLYLLALNAQTAAAEAQAGAMRDRRLLQALREQLRVLLSSSVGRKTISRDLVQQAWRESR